MKNCRKFVRPTAVLLALASFWGFAAQAQDNTQQPTELSTWRAKRMLVTASKYALVGWYRIDVASIQVSAQQLSFTATKKDKAMHYVVNLNELPVFSSSCDELHCLLRWPESPRSSFEFRDIEKKKARLVAFDGPYYATTGKAPCEGAEDQDACLNAGPLFASALNGLRGFALKHPNVVEDFHQHVGARRAAADKVSPAEAVDVYRLAAEDAIDHKAPVEALNFYELGVQTEPTWALGWYNAALIAAEDGDYAAAAEHMQNYLELMPDAQDAQAARDRVKLWRYKAGK